MNIAASTLWKFVALHAIAFGPALALPPTVWTDPCDTVPSARAWAALPAFSGSVAGAWAKIPLQANAKVLFIGNSLTGAGGSIDGPVRGLLTRFHPGLNITVKSMGRGEAWLRDYIEETELGILDSIRSGHWDVLVCQPYQDSYWPKMPGSSASDLAGLRVFTDACDSLYRECRKVGMQMVLWSVHGYQSDDRFWYLGYSAYNCRRVARRLNIPYAFTSETFDTVYRHTDNAFLWVDIIHQSTEASAVYSALIYSVLMGGEQISGWPSNWSSMSQVSWGSSLRYQSELTSSTIAAIGRQNAWNFTGTALDSRPGLHVTASARPIANRYVLANGRILSHPQPARSSPARGCWSAR